ncbi:MAG TPA: serine hydrolase [Candidatus Limnocylindrales bacterium]|nr:serine hydrolase [Candidatus Limnocylindrales bacterium]
MSKSVLRLLSLALAVLLVACSAQPQATPSPTPVASTLPTAVPSASPIDSPGPTDSSGPTDDPGPTDSPTPTDPSATETPGSTPTPALPTPTRVPGTATPARSPMPDVGLAAELGADLQAALDEHRTERNIPGIGAAVIFPDGSIWTGGSGDARLEPQEAATGDTPFVVGSITKTFVTAAVMQLHDEGQLSLEEPISTWLPDYPNAANITVRQLLNHRSGIYNYFEHPTYDLQVFGTMRGHSWTPQEILDTFVLEPYFEPGTDYHYSNTNFILLGLIIEQITGQPLGDVLVERYFEPLGLADTYFQGNGPPPPSAAAGYLLRPTGFRVVDDETDYQPTVSAATVAWAAGAIAGSARDMAIWGDALYGGHVVSPDSLAQMENWTYYPRTDETYGLGTRSREFAGERMFGHTGSIRGYAAAMWHFKESNMTIVTLTNRGRIDANPTIDALAAVVVRGSGEAASRSATVTALGATMPARISAATMAETSAAELRAVLNQQRTSLHIPGAAAAVIFPDGSIWKAGSGLGQMNPDKLATPKTPFVVGSITKTYVTAAIMKLAEEGALSIDDPLANWLPDYPRADQITLRHLLSHTSGVFNYFEHSTYNRRVFVTDKGHAWTPQEILDEFGHAPDFAPGEGFRYSNTGFILLGLVIEAETGKSLGTVLRQRFLTPLGLRKTYFQGDGPPPAGSAQGYLYKSGVWKEWSDSTGYQPTISAATVAWAAGGMVSSARDVAKWCAALYGGSVLSPASLAQMTDFGYSPYADGTYGLGTRYRVKNGRGMIGHTGSLRGFDAAMWHYPDSGVTVAVVTNLGRVNVNPMADALADALGAEAVSVANAALRQNAARSSSSDTAFTADSLFHASQPPPMLASRGELLSSAW